MSAEEMGIEDDLKVHSWILSEHDKRIKLIGERTHDLKSAMDGMTMSLSAMNKTISEIVKNQSELSNSMSEFTTVKNILMGRFFWVVLGMGTIILLDHLPFLQNLIKGN